MTAPHTSPRDRLVLALLSVVAASFIGMAWSRHDVPPEPVFKGHPMSWWLTPDHSLIEGVSPTSSDLRAMGPDAVRWLAYTAEHGRIGGNISKTSIGRQWDAAVQWIRFRMASTAPPVEPQEAADAMALLRALGSDAAPAIPTLVRIIEREGDRDFPQNLRAREAANTLARIGSPALPEYLRLVTTRPPEVRDQLVASFTSWSNMKQLPEADCTLALDILMTACHSPNDRVRYGALCDIAGLSFFHGFRPAMQPAIAATIDFDRKAMREDIAYVLGSYGKEASAAIPRLVELLDDPDPESAGNAALALSMIDRADKRVIPTMRLQLSSPDSGRQEIARRVLQRFGESLEDAPPLP